MTNQMNADILSAQGQHMLLKQIIYLKNYCN